MSFIQKKQFFSSNRLRGVLDEWEECITFVGSITLNQTVMLEIHFAPLQGYTEDCYRRIHHALCGGVDYYYTPFLRLEHGKLRSKDLRDVKPENNVGVPVVPQLIVRDVKELDALLQVIRLMGYQRVDINMGCPFPLQTNHGRGAGLLARPDEVRCLCEKMATNSDLAFSVKMRIGLTTRDEWRTILPMLNDIPLTHVAVHPRLASQGYKGEVDMEAFGELYAVCRHRLIYNGDITSVEDIIRIEKSFPNLQGVMIGRGLLARPSLGEEYRKGVILPDDEVIKTIKAMHDGMAAAYARFIPGESQLLMKLRTFWDFMEPTIGRKPWKKIHKAGHMRNYLAAVAEL